MRSMLRVALLTGLAAGFVVAPLLAQSAEAEHRSSTTRNILVTIRMGELDDGDPMPQKSYQILATDGGKLAEFVSGKRIPIPVTSFQTSTPPSGQMIPITSYTYQDVGFTAQVHAWVRSDDSIELHAQIEDSYVDENSRSAQPTILTQHQQIRGWLTPSVPLQITSAWQPSGNTVYFEVEAEILD